MAYPSFTLYGGSPTAEVDASASVVSQTDTTATIRVTMWARLKSSSGEVWSSGVKGKATINGKTYDQQRIFGVEHDHSGNSWQKVTRDHIVDKGSSKKDIVWKAEFHSWVDDTDLGEKAEISGKVSVSAINYKAPYDPTEVKASRDSDNRNTVSWEQDGTGMSGLYPWGGFYILRSTDGGEMSRIMDMANWEATSYVDATTSENHFYKYAIQTYGPGGVSEVVAADDVLYNTPCSPAKITASRLAETTVKLEIANDANTATSIEIQRSTNGENWETVATIEGTPVTETTDEPGGGTFYYRARNIRGELVSDWSPVSNAVVTICAPAAPTLKAPASGMVVSKSQEAVMFEWSHNPIDGSAQTAAKLRYSTDKGATYTEASIDGSAASYALENVFAVNEEVTWGVCTKGAHDDFGPWSDNRVLFVYQAPSVAFAQPTDGFVVENTPIHIELQYGDPSGTLANATLLISDETRTVYTRNMGTATECDILATEWLPDNGKVYTLVAQVRSSSSLYASAVREISVSFVLPQPAGVFIENDPETGYASLVVYVDEEADLEAAKSISVWRESEEGRVLLAEGLQAGAGVVDMYAPLNIGYQYIATSFADSGAANSQTFDNLLATKWAFLYFAGGGIARGMWNPEDSWKMDQDADFVHYIGREHPVAYMRDSMDETHDVTVTLMDREEMRAFRKMMATHEPVVAKLWDSLVFHAVPQVQGKPRGTVSSYWGEVAVKLTRIDGEAL